MPVDRRPNDPPRRDGDSGPPPDAAAPLSDELLHLLVERVEDYAIFVLDAEGRVATWNAGAERIKGYTAGEIIGRPYATFFTAEDRAAGRPEHLLGRARIEGRVEDVGWRERKDGSRFWADAVLTALYDDGGELRGYAKVTRDLTERQRAEEQALVNTALRELAEARDRALVQAEAERRRAEEQAAALAGERERFAFLAEAGRVLGASLDYESTVANVADLAVPHVADWCVVDLLDERGELRRLAVAHADPEKVRLADELQRRFPPAPDAETGAAHVVRTRESELVPEITDEFLERAARTPEHLALLRELGLRSYMVVPVCVPGQVMGAITFVAAGAHRRYGPQDLVVAEDLARRVAVAIENARLYRRAQEAIRVRDDFLAAASHDLKNPLGSIRGNAQLLLRTLERTGAVPPQRLTSSLANIIGSTDQMVGQINALLDVARLRLGEPLPLERVPTDLVALAGRAVAAHQAATERHHIELRAEEAALVGEWDAARLERVLGNLLSNAIKYSPDGGEVRVTVRREGDEAVLTVSDQGVGIPAEDLPRVFERFERARNVVGRIGGSGIGLAASKQIVEQHGGTIAAESREPGAHGVGGGSTFTVRLPTSARPSATSMERP